MADHPEVDKLYQNIKKHSDAATAEEIVGSACLPADAEAAGKAAWVAATMDALDRRFDETTIKAIRMGCHCDVEGRLPEMKQWLRALYNESSSLPDFVDRGQCRRRGMVYGR